MKGGGVKCFVGFMVELAARQRRGLGVVMFNPTHNYLIETSILIQNFSFILSVRKKGGVASHKPPMMIVLVALAVLCGFSPHLWLASVSIFSGLGCLGLCVSVALVWCRPNRQNGLRLQCLHGHQLTV